MTDSNQFGATPENNQQNPQPEQPTQPIPSPTTEFPNSYTASADTPTTPIHAQPDATQTPAYTPAPEYGAYATPTSSAQQSAPTPEYGQYAVSRASRWCQALVRFFALLRIKPHAPLLVRAPVNSFEF